MEKFSRKKKYYPYFCQCGSCSTVTAKNAAAILSNPPGPTCCSFFCVVNLAYNCKFIIIEMRVFPASLAKFDDIIMLIYLLEKCISQLKKIVLFFQVACLRLVNMKSAAHIFAITNFRYKSTQHKTYLDVLT